MHTEKTGRRLADFSMWAWMSVYRLFQELRVSQCSPEEQPEGMKVCTREGTCSQLPSYGLDSPVMAICTWKRLAVQHYLYDSAVTIWHHVSGGFWESHPALSYL